MNDDPIPARKKPRRGGQPANKNALKHGLYARHFTKLDRVQPSEMPPLQSLHEIYLLRAALDSILTLIEECEDEDRRVKLHNSLFNGMQRLLLAMHTHTYLVGDNQEVLTDFWKALEAFQDEVGLQESS